MSAICTFFGHRDAPGELRPPLEAAIREMIESHGVDVFYVGDEGRFDAMAQHILRQLQSEHPGLQCRIILPYHPSRIPARPGRPLDTLYPEGFGSFPPRFAIANRNRWMLKQADFVITYVRRSWGGAAQFAQLAARRRKTVIQL